MKSGILVAVAGAAAVTSVTAFSLPFHFGRRTVQGHGYLSIPVNEVKPDMSELSKRDAFEVLINNRQFYYSMDIMMGTPGQKVTVLLDTGSSELWVNPDCSTASTASQARQCSAAGQYVPRNSKTPPIGPFDSRKLNYGDPSQPSTQTSAEIAYYSDTIGLGSGTVLNQTFGVVTKSSGIATGILGLAPDLRSGYAPGKPYSLVLNSLKDQGVINVRAFSLDLRHAGSDTGALIFGGVDKGKYIGKLENVRLIAGSRNEPRLAVTLGGLGLSLPNTQTKTYTISDDDKNVMLDSGTTLTRLHPSLANPILADLKATADSDGYWVADCNLRTPPLSNGGSDAYVTFQFGRKVLRVPLSDFILDIGPKTGVCYVGLVTTSDQQILGDSVLRAGYFVFDWDNQAVHIAQASNCGKEQIITLGKGTSPVPDSAVGLCEGPSGDVDSSSGGSTTVSTTTTTAKLQVSTGPIDAHDTSFSISFTLPTYGPFTPTASTSVSATTTAAATAQETSKTLTPSSSQTTSSSGTGTQGTSSSTTSSSDAHSAAFSWASDSRDLCLLVGSLMTLAAVLWNVQDPFFG
ncbi:putative aspartic-type endopeptidase opsB [Colletotrichum gloeosporioides]|uniref:Putative aspartic-type endopeptidase opsB n=1 Tax=Colletotrichum gloeosporioides TaxID=474922 RepID=A0A8H4FBS8_COLGL|nr:putative aspartic-type endopeptidase opsB [Colletotrichum gloeosporioides]KAF3797343.1 putative aspartic-type endopeptidase opsB [Colletotrichum gloeosporioides]